MIPTRIISRAEGKVLITRSNGRPHSNDGYLCDDGVVYTCRGLYRKTGVLPQTIWKRIVQYGLTSHLVLRVGRISMVESAENTKEEEPPTPVWDRSKCRRYGINCTNYSECQAQRCGCEGSPTWQHRDDTDSCYVEPPPVDILKGYDPTVLAEWGFTR